MKSSKKSVQVALLPDLSSRTAGTLGVVIDTLRFTTTACQALVAGARSLRVTTEVETARQLAGPNALLCGERHCNLIPGFDLGNSPREYSTQRVSDRELVFTTTNGTKAVEAARDCSRIVLAALVNRTAVAEELASCREEAVSIFCAGTDGEPAAEDILAAGAIVADLRQRIGVLTLVNDSALLAEQLWMNIASKTQDAALPCEITNVFRAARGGANLVENGYEEDLLFASQVDSLSIVPCSIPSNHQHFCVV